MVRTRQSGWFLVELVICLALATMLVVALAALLEGISRLNQRELVRQRCIAAAQAQLDSLALRGKCLPDDQVERLWPGVTARVERAPGTGDWQGLTLVKVTAAGTSRGSGVQVVLSRYVAEDK